LAGRIEARPLAHAHLLDFLIPVADLDHLTPDGFEHVVDGVFQQ
jgi:hypothetical protein